MKQEAEMERYRKLLEEDSASKLLNFSEKSSIIKRSMQEAQSQQQRLIRQFGMREAEGYIKELGYRIEEEEPELMPHTAEPDGDETGGIVHEIEELL